MLYSCFVTLNRPKSEDTKLQQYKRQATIMKNKRIDLERKLESAKKDFDKVSDEKKRLETELQKYANEDMPSEKAFEQLKKDVIAKAAIVKKMKVELNDVRAELAILRQTSELLKSKHANIQEFLDKSL